MCYYISITPSLADIERVFGARFTQPESYQPVYSASAFSYPFMPVISSENPQVIEFYQWGLIPFWVKDIEAAKKIRQRTLNARSETIFEKPSFRHSIMTKRCLVIADGFFEWRHENKKAYPYYIKLKNNKPFTIAGIWDSWKNRDTNEELRTFSIITTIANSLVEKIHNTRKRMPVILPADKEKEWLDENLTKEQIAAFLKSFDAGEMDAYTVSNIVNKQGHNTANPEALAEHEYPDLSRLLI
jgi:putative SOS response-associated peptidase YedK